MAIYEVSVQMDRKTEIEILKQTSNIWAMLSAAGFAAALFQGAWIMGPLFGVYAAGMSMRTIKRRVRLEKEESL